MGASFSDAVTNMMVKQAAESKSMYDAAVSLFESKNAIDDGDVHTVASKNGYDKHKFEGEIYKLAKKYVNFLKGGKSKGVIVDASKVGSKLLETAIQIEMEHTPDRDTAIKIVSDHVTELGWIYYKSLPAFESMLKKISGKKD